MSICSNCEYETATQLCSTCSADSSTPVGDTIYCENCFRLHLQLKPFRLHVGQPYRAAEAARASCSNCDTELGKFKCMHCPEGENRLCNGCSILHTRIKQFRGHAIVALDRVTAPMQTPLPRQSGGSNSYGKQAKADSGSSSEGSIHRSQVASAIVENAITLLGRVVGEDLVEQFRHQESAGAAMGLGVALVAYLPVRYFFGSLATALGCVVALVLFRALYGDRRVVAIKAAALAPLARGRGEEHDEQKFTDEFWHNKEGRQARLRQRVRPYRSRSAVGAHDSDQRRDQAQQ